MNAYAPNGGYRACALLAPSPNCTLALGGRAPTPSITYRAGPKAIRSDSETSGLRRRPSTVMAVLGPPSRRMALGMHRHHPEPGRIWAIGPFIVSGHTMVWMGVDWSPVLGSTRHHEFILVQYPSDPGGHSG